MAIKISDLEPNPIVIVGITFLFWQQDVVADILAQAVVKLAARLHVLHHAFYNSIAIQRSYSKLEKSLVDQAIWGPLLPSGHHPSVWHR